MGMPRDLTIWALGKFIHLCGDIWGSGSDGLENYLG